MLWQAIGTVRDLAAGEAGGRPAAAPGPCSR